MSKANSQPQNLPHKHAEKYGTEEVFMEQLPEHLLRMIYEAKKGDTIAARNALTLLSLMLASTKTNQFTDKPLSEALEMPEWARGYLSQSLNRILAGESADKAFNLKRERGGRSTAWSYYAKLAAADTVHYYHTHSREMKTTEESCAIVAEGINRLVTREQRTILASVGLGHFIGKQEITQELVQKWYFKLKKDTNFNGIQGKRIAQLMKVDLRNPP